MLLKICSQTGKNVYEIEIIINYIFFINAKNTQEFEKMVINCENASGWD